LRDRTEDIPQLADFFLRRYNGRFRKHIQGITDPTMAMLQKYWWPGNIRELENAIERAVILWPAQVVEPEAFPPQMSTHSRARGPQLGGDFSLDEIEREHISRVLARTTTLEDAAAVLKVDPSTLWRKRKKYED
jgi:NtrC-family two-component system response regulator AlgB